MGNSNQKDDSVKTAMSGESKNTVLDDEGFGMTELIIRSMPSVEITISLSCSDLYQEKKSRNVNPFIVIEEYKDNRYSEIGRTEKIVNNRNPKFIKTFKYSYIFQYIQVLKISVYDAEHDFTPDLLVLDQQKLIGYQELTISEIITEKKGCKRELINPFIKGFVGSLNVSSEEIPAKNEVLTFSLGISYSPKKNPVFFTINSLVGDNLCPCYRSEVVDGSPKFTFETVSIDTATLCHCNHNKEIVFFFFEYDRSGKHRKYGESKSTLSHLTTDPQFPIVGLGKNSNQIFGTVNINLISKKPKVSFIQYIYSGCELNFMVAIDFTASNGKPTDEGSLHYLDPYKPNQYEQAILSIGNILLCYDHDKLIPAYLFGGKVNGKPEHCYPLNNNYENPEIYGIDELLKQYRQALHNHALFGPTCLSPILRETKKIVEQYDPPNIMRYLVLLILTDGSVDDLEDTKEELKALSALPISIIIIGIGDANFTQLSKLDRDNKQSKDRDLVHFVTMSEVLRQPFPISSVLQEVPQQLCDYMFMKDKFPPN